MTIINQFWYEMHKDINSVIELDPLRILSIKSFLIEGYTIHFYSYQSIITPINHPNFYLKDARDIISEKIFTKLKLTHWKPKKNQCSKNVHIAHFADWFRAVLLFKRGGWWFDTDSYCLNKLPIPDKIDKGVILTSLPTKVEGSLGIKKNLCTDTIEIRKKGIWKGWNGKSQFSNSVMYSEKGNPLMKKIASAVRNCFFKPLTHGFIEPMLVSYNVVKKEGYMGSIRPPICFIPLCWWKCRQYLVESYEEHKRTSFGANIPTYDQIIKNSSTVNFYNGTFEYISNKKRNTAQLLFDYLCKKCEMNIDSTKIYKDIYDSNYHVSNFNSNYEVSDFNSSKRIKTK